MVAVEKMVDHMVVQVQRNTANISKIIEQFMDHVYAANKDISSYCTAIIQRGIRNDPTLETQDVMKATAIVNFTGASVTVMKATSEAALELAHKGMGYINQDTLAAITLIFEIRTRDVALFSQKLDVFHKQEAHDLDIMLKIQDAKLKEEQQIFTQLKEIVQIDEAKKEASFKRILEVKKVEFEQLLQVRSQNLKEEEVSNKHQIDQASLIINERLKNKELSNNKDVQVKQITSAEALKNAEIASNEKVKNWEILAKKQTDQSKIEADKQVGITTAIAGIAKSSCSVM